LNKYEGIFIIKPTLGEEEVKAVLDLVEGEIKKNDGKIIEVKSWGKKALAYSIKKFNEGLYYCMDFEAVPTTLKGMDVKFRLNDDIVRFLIIKKDEEKTGDHNASEPK